MRRPLAHSFSAFRFTLRAALLRPSDNTGRPLHLDPRAHSIGSISGFNGRILSPGAPSSDPSVVFEGRLNAVGLNLHQPAIWFLRGGRTSLERRRKTQAIGKAKWAYGAVRDEEVAIVDAIADLRWLRSGVAAHDVKDLARLLSVFDVANAQWLARRCLLACLRGGESPVK